VSIVDLIAKAMGKSMTGLDGEDVIKTFGGSPA